MASPQYRLNFRLKKNNEYLGTIYLGDPLPVPEDVIMIGDKKYAILEIQAGSSQDTNDVFVEEVKKK